MSPLDEPGAAGLYYGIFRGGLGASGLQQSAVVNPPNSGLPISPKTESLLMASARGVVGQSLVAGAVAGILVWQLLKKR